MGHTALQQVGEYFAFDCQSLTTVVLPDTVTEVGKVFLTECGRVQVTSGSTAVQAAAAEHNADVDSESNSEEFDCVDSKSNE